jgi:hypothetical protein
MMSEALNLLEALCLPPRLVKRARDTLDLFAKAGCYSGLRFAQVSADHLVNEWRALKYITSAEADMLRDVFGLAVKARDDLPSAPAEVAQAHARWVSGLTEQLAKFAALATLTTVQTHVWFVEKLLANVAGMGLAAEVVAAHRQLLVEAAGAVRRRLIPRWQEAVPLFGAEFFAVTEDELAALRPIAQGGAL